MKRTVATNRVVVTRAARGTPPHPHTPMWDSPVLRAEKKPKHKDNDREDETKPGTDVKEDADLKDLSIGAGLGALGTALVI
jgi:hypothetical protein